MGLATLNGGTVNAMARDDVIVGIGDDCAVISGDARNARVTVPDECRILDAAHKASTECHKASSMSPSRHTAWFTAGEHDISNIQLLVECCHDED